MPLAATEDTAVSDDGVVDSPTELLPQQRTEPLDSNATVCDVPAAIAVTVDRSLGTVD